ncbi:MAG: hypothetical protein IIA98_09845 [Proteobacteria bacterium]|nr:hypothetical protein [Pseudomonadota bacterium]
MLNSIPDSVIRNLDIDFPGKLDPVEAFDLAVFIITLLVVCLIFAVWLQFKYDFAQGQRRMMKDIRAALGYLAIRQDGPIARPGATVDRPKNTPSSCKEA